MCLHFTARDCDVHKVAVTLESTCPAVTASDVGFAAPSIVKIDRRSRTNTWDIYTCQLPVDVAVVVRNTVSTVSLTNLAETVYYDCSGMHGSIAGHNP